MFSIIQAAGWPIWPLLACSVLALALVIERFISLRTAKIAPPRLLAEVLSVTRSSVPPPDVVNHLEQTSALGEVLARGLRALKFRDDEILTVVRTLFVSHTDADYAKLLRIFDRDNDGGIDPYEFREICSLFGDHATEAEARELFVGADEDNDGSLNVAEFTQLIKRITPKARGS